MKKIIILLLLISCSQFLVAQMNAGIARKKITPEVPVWLSGYASRNKPAEGVLHDLWAKALAIEDAKGNRVIIVTTDIIGLTHDLYENAVRHLNEKYGIDCSHLIINSSHTHSGPVIWPSLSTMYELKPADIRTLVEYGRKLGEDITGVIDSAILDLKPMNLSIAHGSAKIAVNRRQSTEKGVVIGINREGPVDNDVPILKIETPDGQLKAVLFGYACHNTTLDGYEVNGDYAGFAQIGIEKANPGVMAMFMAGCGADQNPDPRRSVEAAIQHGKNLADEVQNVLSGQFRLVHSPLKTSYTTVSLEFAPVTAEAMKEEILGDNIYRMKRANFVLNVLEKGYDISSVSYPVQAIRFGRDFTILALGGEVVVDYSLNVKKRYPKENLFVAGYCSEVQCYIPSRRILREGGYEPETSMVYYGMPGPFTENVEEKILSAVGRVMKKTGARVAR